MKNKINILIFAFLLTSGSLMAQEFGIKGGVNIPTSDALINPNDFTYLISIWSAHI